MTFEEHATEVGQLLADMFGLSDTTCINEDRLRGGYENGESPLEFVSGLAAKYDLSLTADINPWGG